MNLKKENLIEHINKIRKEIGHENNDIQIQKLILNENTNELWIITPDRPDKSAIIGKGGWVVGRLKEETGFNKIHVESYSDFLLREYRMKLSLESLNSFIKENTNNYNDHSELEKPEFLKPMKNLKDLLEEKINNLYDFNLKDYFNSNTYNDLNSENKNDNNNHAILALSGGVDSSFSLILAKKLGFNPLAITIDPGTIILPKQFKDNINKLCNDLDVKHEYIPVNYSEIIKNSLNGRFHPCGRCSSVIESTLFDYAEKNNIKIVIFGDMLSTGFQCITKHTSSIENEKHHQNEEIKNNNTNNRSNNINNTSTNINSNNNSNNNYTNNKFKENKFTYRLNLPATLSIGKEEIKNTVSKYNLGKIKGFGCPLLYETHKKYPYLKKFSIQRILRETRAGVLEPGEALNLIWSFYNTE